MVPTEAATQGAALGRQRGTTQALHVSFICRCAVSKQRNLSRTGETAQDLNLSREYCATAYCEGIAAILGILNIRE